MKLGDRWLILDSVDSTQLEAARLLLSSGAPDVLFAHDQTQGKGRLGRTWQSAASESLTMSLVFHEYQGHAKPWLIGMSCAIAAAQVVSCNLQWPNDLVINGKVGGVLTEVLANHEGMTVPVVGIGINISFQPQHPELRNKATTLAASEFQNALPIELAKKITLKVKSLPEPVSWSVLDPLWKPLDKTPGKRYKTPDGEIVIADHVDDEGRLVARSETGTHVIYAAEAMF